ncbi:phage antirepressor [Lactobacillus gigeriorum]|uniref:BRO family, N-terminal domain protein n=1 Tax=Lactobacillus gigeriorum DSM 23908 = CRBIP 24.85 TaxID=1423751 RepID=I7KNG1_9LACO|nr:phage antirepressor KilAC domain-containing protein [Lactobacillus gigeriorum]KRN08715.1 BRO family, N-terminal domain protein [Lactobacillus gigeriorum DSM 23908 = CRBIP 24.85]CCI86709.1 BRO family, N-terminal domain protein [Lactobacillus gigeriorum DSM 23908 = CRBIP 24.85]
MNKDIKLFDFEGSHIRIVLINDQPWFVGKDIAEILGYASPRSAISKNVPDKFKGVAEMETPSGMQNMTIISEPGLYKLIFKSHAPNAERFNDFVAEEILPAIRKHGAYMTPEKIQEVLLNPDTIIQLATELKKEREGRLIAEQRVNELQPKATYYDKVLANPSLVTISAIAKDYGMSAMRMNKLLHELKVQFKQGTTWLLYAKYQQTGWTHSNTTMVTLKDGTEKAVLNTKWTQKGRLGLYELLKANGYLPLIEKDQPA